MGVTSIASNTRIDLREFYTTSNPSEILEARQHVRAKVEEYWQQAGNPIPESIKALSRAAVRARHVATGRREDYIFARTAGILGLTPAWSEFGSDKYVQISRPKTSLLKLPLTGGTSISIADPQSCEDQILSEITTYAGTNMMDFHHRLWSHIPGEKVRFDCSQWVQSFGKAKDYYFPELSLYVAHGILFSDFHGKPNPLSSNGSAWFTEQIVEPAFHRVVEVFGHKPLIFPFSYQSGFEVYPYLSYDSRKAQKNGR